MSAEQIWKRMFAFCESRVLMSAVELDVFTALADGPLELSELVKELRLHPRHAGDFFDALVSLKLLERQDDRYSNTPATAEYLVRTKPETYAGDRVENFRKRIYPFYANLTEGLRTGLPQNEAREGRDVFQEIYEDPAALKTFLAGMSGGSIEPARALAKAFAWSDFTSVADIGTAQGCCPTQLLLAHPHLTGIGFDLPPVKPHFEEYVSSFGLASRCRFVLGDFMKDPLPSADVLVIGHVLHCWADETKLMILRKAFDALPSGGAVLVYDTLVDDARVERTTALLMSLLMLIETGEGTDYTAADCRGWMESIGFQLTFDKHLSGDHYLVGGFKP
jgi:hypothetical protein